MSTGYREAHPHCPACSGELLPHELSQEPASVVDVCRECAGIWVDWFDGELTGIARDAGGARPAPESARPGKAITPSCPRCRRPLHEERYRDGAAVLLRCGECAGAFVPRASAKAIASLSVDAGGEDKDAGFLGKLIERVRQALGV